MCVCVCMCMCARVSVLSFQISLKLRVRSIQTHVPEDNQFVPKANFYCAWNIHGLGPRFYLTWHTILPLTKKKLGFWSTDRQKRKE